MSLQKILEELWKNHASLPLMSFKFKLNGTVSLIRQVRRLVIRGSSVHTTTCHQGSQGLMSQEAEKMGKMLIFVSYPFIKLKIWPMPCHCVSQLKIRICPSACPCGITL